MSVGRAIRWGGGQGGEHGIMGVQEVHRGRLGITEQSYLMKSASVLEMLMNS